MEDVAESGRLTPDEDATLRRLHWFERFGADLAPSLRVLKATIRSRDLRSAIREPDERYTQRKTP